jgi:hypothetical protein
VPDDEPVKGADDVQDDVAAGDTAGTVSDEISKLGQDTVKAVQEAAESVTVENIADQFEIKEVSIAQKNDAVTKLQANDLIKVDETTGAVTLSDNGDAATVTVVHEVYLEVEATAYDAESKSITLNIEPKYNVKAVVTTGEGIDAREVGAVTLESGKDATVSGGELEMSVALPEAVVDTTAFGAGNTAAAYVIHDHDCTMYVYDATIEKAGGTYTLSFKNPNGFSSFTTSLKDPTKAALNGVNYASLQSAVDVASKTKNNTVTVYDGKATAKITSVVGTLTLKPADNVELSLDYVDVPSGYTATLNKDGTITIKKKATSVGGGGSLDAEDTVNSETLEFEDGTTAIVTDNEDGTVTADVTLPEGVEKTTIVIPVTNATAGLVAKDANGKIVKLSVVNEAGDGLAVTLTESTTLTIVDNSRTYTDVAEDYWGADSIAFASAHELFKSTGDDVTFAPDDTLNRYMMMTILGRLDDQDMNDTGATWYVDGQNWAVAQEISDGTNGDRDVTREEMVTMLWRYAGKPEANADGKDINDFADADSVMEYAKEAMAWAVSNNIIKGGDNGIDPQGNAKRAEVATIMQRYCTLLTK